MCCGFIVDEMICLGKLAFPTMLFNTLEILLLVTDMMMLGGVSKDALAVGALGNAFFHMMWYFNEGVLTAQDNLSSQSFGLRDQDGIRQWMYVSVVVMFPLCVVGTIIMLFAPLIVEDVFRLQGDMISNTALYVMLLIPALWFQAAFRIGQKYLLAQHVLRPSLYCIVAGLGINLFFNTMFMIVVDGGAAGCAAATSIARGCMVLLLGAYLKYSSEHSDTFDKLQTGLIRYFQTHKAELMKLKDRLNNPESIRGASSSSSEASSAVDNSEHSGVELSMSKSSQHSQNDDMEDNDEDTDTLLSTSGASNRKSGTAAGLSRLYQTKRDVLLFLSLGIPGGLVLIVELWTFDIATIAVSQIGNVSVAAQSILILYTTTSFVLIPLAISIAASVRVSQLLASQNSEAAKVSALTALFVATLFSGVSSYAFYSLRDLLGYLFTSDIVIVRRCSQLADVFAVLQFINGIQGASQGVMRGMSRQKELFGFTLFAYWVVGLPLGMYLTFFTRPRFGLYGLWCGFCTGLSLLALVLLWIILGTDWDREMRRTQLRIERFNQLATPLAWTRGGGAGHVGGGVDTRGRLAFLTQASAIPGSRALGGFAMLDSRTEDDELDDYERIEILLADGAPATSTSTSKSKSKSKPAGLDNSRQGLYNSNDDDDML